MATVHEILKASGMTDEMIAGLDAKAITAFNGVLSTAEQERKAAMDSASAAEQERKAALQAMTQAEKDRLLAREAQEAAELATRSYSEFYEKQIAPALTGWEEEKKRLAIEKANAESKAAFFMSQIEGAKAAGFLPVDAPAFVLPQQSDPSQPRDNSGRYLPNQPGGTPGSPTFMDPDAVIKRASDGLAILSDIQWRHQSLYGKPLPLSPSQLIAQADAVKLDPMTYAARTFNFDARQREIDEQHRSEERAKIAAEATAPFEAKLAEAEANRKKAIEENDRKWAEKIGSNPDVRIAQTSRYADVTRAVQNGERPDPLKLSDSQRRQATSTAIRADLAETAVA